MTQRRILLLAALISVAPVTVVMAQTAPQTQTDTSPSAASSPHQREATQSNATETPLNDGMSTQSTSPSAASTPHQQQATRMASKQSMKECIAKQQADNSGMSSADAKKACKAQMKANRG